MNKLTWETIRYRKTESKTVNVGCCWGWLGGVSEKVSRSASALGWPYKELSDLGIVEHLFICKLDILHIATFTLPPTLRAPPPQPINSSF